MNAMDKRARAILEEARATIERVERGQQERAAERAEREATLLHESGDRPSRRASRIDDGGLVYKTTTQPEPQVTTMDPAAANAWDARIRTAWRNLPRSWVLKSDRWKSGSKQN